jgi:hypothetical protein
MDAKGCWNQNDPKRIGVAKMAAVEPLKIFDEGTISPPGNWGGCRPGAGRKSRGSFAPLPGDTAYAKAFVSLLMRDETQPNSLRAKCALAIVMRGISPRGRPLAIHANPVVKATVEQGGGSPVTMEVIEPV